MYTSVRDRPAGAERPRRARGRGRGQPRVGRSRVGPTVVCLGLTSLFTDVSSEMVNAVLPLYLMSQLGFSPLQFGLFDGVYQGTTAVLRVGGGLVADRWQSYRQVAAFGYGLSAVSKLGLLGARTRAVTAAVLLADRTGKGIRTAPRDALISLSSRPGRLGESFGVHRALDTAGAMGGPVLAFLLLGLAPRAYDAVFFTSFCVALIGLGILVVFVRNPPPAGDRPPRPALRLEVRAAAGLLRTAAFRRLTAVGALLGAVTVSDAFLYLCLQRRLDMPVRPFPLLFVGTAAVYLVLAVPLGRLADRVGRWKVFLAGHGLLAAAYLSVWAARPGFGGVALPLACLGASYAATDGVLMAMATGVVPERLRASGLALLTTVTVSARLVAAVTFGLLWSSVGPQQALLAFLAAIAAALPVAAALLRPVPAPVLAP